MILKVYRISTAMKLNTTLRNILVHPKDRIRDDEKSELIYQVPYMSCDRVYIGETGKLLGTKKKEQCKVVESRIV